MSTYSDVNKSGWSGSRPLYADNVMTGEVTPDYNYIRQGSIHFTFLFVLNIYDYTMLLLLEWNNLLTYILSVAY